MRFGIQLFGLMPLVKANPEAVFDRLRRAGYRHVEPCVAFGELDGFESVIGTQKDYAEAKPLLKKYGLEVASCHVFAPDLRAAIPHMIDFAREQQIKQLVVNCPREQSAYREFASTCAELAQRLSPVGAELLLHSGEQDCVARVDGKCGYEWLLDTCGCLVGAQPDVGWLLYGGVDPVAFLWRMGARVRSLHYKDVCGAAGEVEAERCNVPLGAGKLDIAACFQFARAAGIAQIIDQDRSENDILADAEDSIKLLQGYSQYRAGTASELCILDTQTGEVTPLRRFDRIIEAPNWLQGQEALIYNSEGALWRYDIASNSEERIDTGFCDNCNNDHVLSPDGQSVAVSHSAKGGWMSQVYVLPIGGGEPRLVTPNKPSFLHGWSPDGEELAYCAFREHDGQTLVDVYAIPAAGGAEKRLTHGEGFNDGPEYAPDGKHIWFNSTRDGLMRIWRMERDGSHPTQRTSGDSNDWFAHVSPDGSKVVYLSYPTGALDPDEHLPNMHVSLWLMNADGSSKRKLLDLFGGQGSINVNSWAADSRRIAFVRYALKHP